MKIDKEVKRQQTGKNMPAMVAKVVDPDRKRQVQKPQQFQMKNSSTDLKPDKTERWKFYLPLAIVIMLSFIVYLPVLQNGFVWDDVSYIKNNPLIYSINLKEIFSQNVVSNYHPLTILTLAIEYHFFGLNEAGYHAVNLLLHLLIVILVFYTVFYLCDNTGVALVAALLFGIHPLHVESVAWASELKDLLYTFFFLASYIFYLKFLKNGYKRFYFFALLLFSISLLSKAMAASLPVVLMLTDYFKGRKINLKTLLEKVPFFLLAIVFGIVAILAQKSSGAIQDMIVPLYQRLVFASYGFITYLYKLFVPLHLSAFYPYPIMNGENIPLQFYIYLILFIGLIASVLYSLRFTKKIFFGIGFFAVTVFLVLQLLPVGGAIMADRYSFIPSIGIFYLVGEGFNLLWVKKFKMITIILLCSFTVFFSVKTYSRCGIWKSDMTLWNDVLSQYQTIPYAFYNRGYIFMNENKYDLALDDFSKAIALKPSYYDAYCNRGTVYMNGKKYDLALVDYNKAIALNPVDSEVYYNRGIIFENKKRIDLALDDYNKAIELDPNKTEAYINRGLIFYNGKKYEQALDDFNKAIELNPNKFEARMNRGNIYYDEKKYDLALADYNKAIELDPNKAQTYNSRGNVYFSENKYEEAIVNYSKAIELITDYVEAYYFRGLAKYYLGKKDAACLDMRKAFSLGYKPAGDALQQICN